MQSNLKWDSQSSKALNFSQDLWEIIQITLISSKRKLLQFYNSLLWPWFEYPHTGRVQSVATKLIP